MIAWWRPNRIKTQYFYTIKERQYSSIDLFVTEVLCWLLYLEYYNKTDFIIATKTIESSCLLTLLI
jgi:hypothetical protein